MPRQEEGVEQENTKEISITIVTVSAAVLGTFSGKPQDSILSLKRQIYDQHGIPPILQRLTVGTHILADQGSLSALSNSGDAPVLLVRLSEARLDMVPDFHGVYLGKTIEEEGNYIFEMIVDSLDFEEDEDEEDENEDSEPSMRFKGILHYKCLAFKDCPQYVGLRGREFSAGSVDKTGCFTLTGYACEQPEHCRGELLSCCSFKWQLKDDGVAIRCSIVSHVTEDADAIDLQRASESFATEFRLARGMHNESEWGGILQTDNKLRELGGYGIS